MSERHICKVVGDNSWDFSPIYEADPEAPSVVEVVDAMKMAREDAQSVRYWEKHYGNAANAAAACQRRDRLDSLIARLEGA